ncbi:hypothetical protein K458DRAFT_484673 [Lentithecium fluviatile CBS 122367]|uniref:Polycomb protein VEFS-Box domain-containing protein n=1 Tax=Lentithecium fluviatile CBS 122367 TaxID=1168545 RepID=A0A6G1JEW6_9PLEO|nr:hypothetical protein K458DRAFT_484673 [Lentithecium fluviatile CBS 122367]
MVGRQDQFIGNILYYEFLGSKRNPTFLRRNLDKVLQYQRTLEAPPIQLAQGCLARSLWKFPSSAALQKMSEDEDVNSGFVLEIIGVEPLNVDGSSRSRGPSVRKKENVFRHEVNVHISIVDTQSQTDLKKVLRRKDKIVGVHSTGGKRVDITTSESIFKLDDLLQTQAPSSRDNNLDCDLVVGINFRNTKDAAEFYMHMAPANSHLVQKAPTRLSVHWPNIEECPPDETILPFTADITGGRGVEGLEFGLKVRMYWRMPEGSILATYNRQRNQSLPASNYPTPPSQPPTPPSRGYHVTFIFPKREMTKHHLCCPYPKCEGKTILSLDALEQHLNSWHYMNLHTPEKEKEADGIQYWTFTIVTRPHEVERQRASNAASDPLEIRYVAENCEAQTTPTPTCLPPRRPDDVKERIQPQRRKYKVPQAPPNVTFFRTISKRPLCEGEEISESDDDVEMDWVQRKKDAQAATNPSMTEANRRFLRLFDPFMGEEGLNCDYYVGDALVRFARDKAAALWQDDIVDEFKIKIADLLEDEIISKDMHDACLAIVNKERAIDVEMGETAHADSDGNLEMRDAATITESKEETAVPPSYEQCLCGCDALSSRGRLFIICDSVDCIRYAFHINCVMKYWQPARAPDPKDDNWTCNECR